MKETTTETGKTESREGHTDDLELNELGQYNGTEQYHRISLFNTKITDGVVYVMRNGYSWFVTDALAVVEMKLKGEEFLAIKLKLKNETAQLLITDGNEKTLYTQDYKWTTAKKELNLFWTNGVLMLSGEY